MHLCHHCGEEIEFRWINGICRPIHVNGGWCSVGFGDELGQARSSFGTVRSYLDPNATCPVCGASVYFYRSPYNGRVFFDDVGWPWPKHPCTDKYHGRDDQIRRATSSRFRVNFRSRNGKHLDVYRIGRLIQREDDLLIWLNSVERQSTVCVRIVRVAMQKTGVTADDISEAPTLILSRDRGVIGETEVSFMSARLQLVVVLAAVVQSD